jgi:hypothetical protein
MKDLFSLLFLIFILTIVGSSFVFGQSNFLKEFEASIDVARILYDSTNNIDNIEITGGGANETHAENGGTVIRNRTFEAEIHKINSSENFDLLKLMKENLVKSLKTHRFKYKEADSFPEGFNLQYSSSCIVGFVSVRGIYKQNDVYYMSFIFNESVCSKRNTRKK